MGDKKPEPIIEIMRYRIPGKLDHKYHGCGSGIVVLDRKTNAVLNFDYTDSYLRILNDQNVTMIENAGEKVHEDDKTVTYRCNFSSYMIYLQGKRK